MGLKEYKQKKLRDKKYRKIIEEYAIPIDIANTLITARIKRGWTQEELAKKMGVKQESIARLENGKHFPTIKTLEAVAKAFNTKLIAPKLEFLEKEKLDEC